MLSALLSAAFCGFLILALFPTAFDRPIVVPTSTPHRRVDERREKETYTTPDGSKSSSPYTSWHTRALLTPHPDPRNFTPTLDALILTMRNFGMHGEGFNMALFSVRSGPGAGDSPAADSESAVGSIAVDPAGRVLLVSPSDTKGISNLAQEALTMPPEDGGGWQSIPQYLACRATSCSSPTPSDPSTAKANPASYHGRSLLGYPRSTPNRTFLALCATQSNTR